jgi:hypothetical protein
VHGVFWVGAVISALALLVSFTLPGGTEHFREGVAPPLGEMGEL